MNGTTAIPPDGQRSETADGQRLLTVTDLAVLLRVSVRAVYNLRHRRVLPPAVKLGASLRWRRADIEQWMADNLDDGTGR